MQLDEHPKEFETVRCTVKEPPAEDPVGLMFAVGEVVGPPMEASPVTDQRYVFIPDGAVKVVCAPEQTDEGPVIEQVGFGFTVIVIVPDSEQPLKLIIYTE